MSEKKSKYAEEAKRIGMDFAYISDTKDWLKNNGLYKEAEAYLQDMANADNRAAFNKAKLAYKKNIVRPFYEQVVVPRGEKVSKFFLDHNPIMDFMSPKGLGSYDDIKKNEKVQNSKYATVSVNDKGEEVVNVPLLRMIEDPGELSDIAHYLDVDAEDLRDHIRNEWKKKKEKEWKDEEKAMRNAIVNGGKIGNVTFGGRKGVLKEFEANPWSSILKESSPDIYAAMHRDVANGTGESSDPTKWLNTHKTEQANDMARNIGLAASTTVLPAMLPAKYVAATPFVTGAGFGATEYGAMANSPYYELNDENRSNIKNAVFAAVTIPAGVQTVLGLGRKFGGPVISKAFSRARKSVIRGEETPSVNERNLLSKSVDDAYKKVLSEANNEYVYAPEQVGGAIQDLAKKLNDTPKAVLNGRLFDDDEVRALLQTEEGLKEIKSYFMAPSRKTFIDWNRRAQLEESGPVRVIYRKAVDATRHTFPMALEEIQALGTNSSGTVQNLADFGAIGATKFANYFYGIKEPVEHRALYKESLKSYEDSNPEQVEQWKRYGIPEWNPLAAEFKEKYGQPETVMGK